MSAEETKDANSILDLFNLDQYERVSVNSLSFLTLLELFIIQRASRRFRQLSLLTLQRLGTLELNQFWHQVGVSDSEQVSNLLRSMDQVHTLSLSFCHHAHDDVLLQIMTSLPNPLALRRLHLYYVHRMTEPCFKHILQLCPNLIELNIGRCHRLTADAVAALSSLTQLKILHLSGNVQLENNALQLLEEALPAGFKFLDIHECTGFDPAYVLELKHNRPEWNIVGPERFVQLNHKKVLK
eukprot:TRINITY_DN4491_c0_g3_i1.p1 TRINITY_DN4491_c0_g3~~TRINITY_DN4491_c0_g3_i1.p1  ORF type:complete len:240 (-),score=18.70 TRINITY_DN4491_c0_g3_i1:268-987(-)